MTSTVEQQPRPEAAETKSEFVRKLEARWAQGNFVCVGLDSDYSQIPQHLKDEPYVGDPVESAMFKFNRMIIDATHDLVCAYKPNTAFYEAQGTSGLKALQETIAYIKRYHPDIPVILDAKRADIGSTNKGYVEAVFDKLGADAVTVHPYLGKEALQPFLDRKDKGILVLTRTSNPGAGEFQDRTVVLEDQEIADMIDGKFGKDSINKNASVPMFLYVAYRVVNHWDMNGNVGIVAGATYPEELVSIREIAGDRPILIPGVGAQGGDLEKAVKAGGSRIILNSSRGIIFASKGEDFAEAAGREVMKLNGEIRKILREKRVNEILEKTEAVLTNDHFILTSGRHSATYINKDWIYPHTSETEELCRMWAEEFKDANAEVVVAPEKGGIILSHETARLLTQITGKRVDGVYAEKSHDSQLNDFIFTRGYESFVKGRRALVVEDILTTGGSAKSVVNLVRETGGEVVGVGAIVNRGKVKPEDVGTERLFALTNVEMESWVPQDCPRCEKGIPINNKIGRGKEINAQTSSSV